MTEDLNFSSIENTEIRELTIVVKIPNKTNRRIYFLIRFSNQKKSKLESFINIKFNQI